MSAQRAVLFVGSAFAAAACLYSVGNVQTDVDGNGLTDASPDGQREADTGDSSVGPFCATQSPTPKFCADFDDAGVLAEGWSGRTASDAGLAALDSLALSPPKSFVSQSNGSGACVYAQLNEDLEGTFVAIHLQFDVRLGNIAGNGGFTEGIVGGLHHADDTGGTCTELINFLPDAVRIGLQRRTGPGTAIDDVELRTGTALPLGQWITINVDVVETGGAATIALSVGGHEVFKPTVLSHCKVGNKPSFSLGLFCTGNANELRFDNVKVDTLP